MVRIDKVYTRGGDGGQTSLAGGRRVAKNHPRVEAYGTVDELSASLGLCRAAISEEGSLSDLSNALARIQQRLFDLGAELATPDSASDGSHGVVEADVAELESAMDRMGETLEPLESFILPAGDEVVARLHLARTVCRRAERATVTLARKEALNPAILTYLNLLCDLLFALARYANKSARRRELFWQSEA